MCSPSLVSKMMRCLKYCFLFFRINFRQVSYMGVPYYYLHTVACKSILTNEITLPFAKIERDSIHILIFFECKPLLILGHYTNTSSVNCAFFLVFCNPYNNLTVVRNLAKNIKFCMEFQIPKNIPRNRI